MNYRRNHDGYYDPTAGEALEHIVHRVEYNAHEHIHHRQHQHKTGIEIILVHQHAPVKAKDVRQHAGNLQTDDVQYNEVRVLCPAACSSLVHLASSPIRVCCLIG